MTSMEKIKQLEAQMEGLVLRVKVAEEERKKAIEDTGTDRRKREELKRRLEETERANQNNQDNHKGRSGTNRMFDNRPIYFQGQTVAPQSFHRRQLKLPIANSG